MTHKRFDLFENIINIGVFLWAEHLILQGLYIIHEDGNDFYTHDAVLTLR